MSITPIQTYVEALLRAVSNESCTGLAQAVEGVSHDCLQRALSGEIEISSVLRGLVNKLGLKNGHLILDDTILEKHTQGLEGIRKLLDTKTGGFIWGLSVVLLCWSDGKETTPIGLFIYKKKGISKLDLAIKLLKYAKHLGLKPKYVLFDAWYAAQKLLKTVIALGWQFVSRLRKNRYLDGKKLKTRHRHPNWQTIGKLKGAIEVKVFRRGDKFYASSDLNLDWKAVKKLYKIRANIEEVFKLVKQHCGWQAVQQRTIRTYYRHLSLGIIAFIYLQKLKRKHKTGIEILRRRLVSGKLIINQSDLSDFLDVAA
jgi:hypothetical protein